MFCNINNNYRLKFTYLCLMICFYCARGHSPTKRNSNIFLILISRKRLWKIWQILVSNEFLFFYFRKNEPLINKFKFKLAFELALLESKKTVVLFAKSIEVKKKWLPLIGPGKFVAKKKIYPFSFDEKCYNKKIRNNE